MVSSSNNSCGAFVAVVQTKPSWGLLFGFSGLHRGVTAIFWQRSPCVGTTVQQVCTTEIPQFGPSRVDHFFDLDEAHGVFSLVGVIVVPAIGFSCVLLQASMLKISHRTGGRRNSGDTTMRDAFIPTIMARINGARFWHKARAVRSRRVYRSWRDG